MFPTTFSGKWATQSATYLVSAMSFIVFLFLDFLDTLLCLFYRFIDKFLEGKATSCYCRNIGEQGKIVVDDDEESEVSETLFGRKNVFREMGFLGLARKWVDSDKRGNSSGGSGGVVVNRWSDCGCESCVSWMNDGCQKLQVVVREPSEAAIENCRGKPTENVIFLHGFLSSSSLWTETVFPNLSEPIKLNYRLFAVDLLGFGRSPKPRNCLYTLKDHLQMIEKSPYFPSSQAGGSITVLNKLAGKTLWPPLLFGSSVMSWYEHLGRCVCFLICRNHRTWEWILKLLTRKRDLPFTLVDLTRHTHHSAWHTMHNVICGGANLMSHNLEAVSKSGVKINVIQGDRDQVVPLECSDNIKAKIPETEVNIILNADHNTVIVGRQKNFTQNLERIWVSSADNH